MMVVNVVVWAMAVRNHQQPKSHQYKVRGEAAEEVESEQFNPNFSCVTMLILECLGKNNH